MHRRGRLLPVLLIGATLFISLNMPIHSLEPNTDESTFPQKEEIWGEGDRPFQLPFAAPPGPNTWLMGQHYGNTVGAYYRRHSLYGASGGIHFGVDLSAPCGTEIVAIADGIVFMVDGPFGSPPHNLTIDHPELGYASMYGHLLEAPDLLPGQRVKQGEVIALVGDSAGLCYHRPHLHLEIRDLDHVRKYNTATLIEANWDSLSLVGSGSRGFMHDLLQPRRWQSIYDQPQAWIGGPILNEFPSTWPFDWTMSREEDVAPSQPQTTSQTELDTDSLPPLRTSAIGRQITRGNCCTQPYWSTDSEQVLFVDRPQPDAPTGIWGVDVEAPSPGEPQLVNDRLGIYSPNGRLIAYPDQASGMAVVERLDDGQKWRIDTAEESISFTPNSQQVVWIRGEDEAVQTVAREDLWIAKTDGENARSIFSGQSLDTIGWLAEDIILLTESIPRTSNDRLLKLAIGDGTVTELMTGPRMRGAVLSPDRQHVVYYVRFEPDPEDNGTWILDLADAAAGPQKAPFFGSYRWRDSNRLIYVPLDPNAITHSFYEYDIVSGQTRSIFPTDTQLTVANNDWQVSPDGTQIVLLAARGPALDGLWAIEID
jgi:murein DD-endopeptidase MepM/ murein hydrolase activator NlpD